jgi:hypothetical protein
MLISQSKVRQTYATNPLWKTVDGPFQISAYNTVTNQDIPFGDLKEISYFKSHGFAIKAWPVFTQQGIEFGYTSKTWGPLVKQLYIRQALQLLITESLSIKRTMGGYGIPDYGPISDYPGSTYVSPGAPGPRRLRAGRRPVRARAHRHTAVGKRQLLGRRLLHTPGSEADHRGRHEAKREVPLLRRELPVEERGVPVVAPRGLRGRRCQGTLGLAAPELICELCSPSVVLHDVWPGDQGLGGVRHTGWW